jgi:SIR2-like domain
MQTIHNPDRYMTDLRQIMSQGRKRIGLFIGAGAATSIRVDCNGKINPAGSALIPDVAGLTNFVVQKLVEGDRSVVEGIRENLGEAANIEAILTQVRRLAQAIGADKIHGLDGKQYDKLGERICSVIGDRVAANLPDEENPYSELVSWIAGTQREHSVEIFTPNYDLLIEEAFERARMPYFDGFTGAHMPFFDPVSISTDVLPKRWSRLWKLHGSLGWDVKNDMIIWTGQRNATKLIYPDHLKYDEIRRLPYSALFERLREFLATPDSLLLCSGFSFFDAHICAVLDEGLIANTHTAVFAFQYKTIAEEAAAVKFALRHPNLSVYARDGAVISGLSGQWQPGQLPNDAWQEIRQTFWQNPAGEKSAEFLLGDFAKLTRFFALIQAQQIRSIPIQIEGEASSVKSAEPKAVDVRS